MACAPSCGGVIEESHKPDTVAIGITQFSVGICLLLHLQKDNSVQQLAAHVATPEQVFGAATRASP